MTRVLIYKAAAQRALRGMDRADTARILRGLEEFAVSGRGDLKALKGALKGRYRLRTGKWRIIFHFEQPDRIVVSDIADRGHAY